MPDISDFHLEPDLEKGVVPISRAASSLAALIKRARSEHRPIIITQKGYPASVLVGVELFDALRAIAEVSQPPVPAPAEGEA
jgi:prevent-host-death family protein